MALETLKNLNKIGGHEVRQLDGTVIMSADENPYVLVDHPNNAITFKIQNGPIKEAGLNGCQVVDMVAIAKHIIEGLNKNFPCRENAMTITKLDEALMWQTKRTVDREARGAEGYSVQ